MMPHQPGGVTQIILQKLTGCVLDHGRDKFRWFTWQSILLDGARNLIIITAYQVTQDNISNCGYITLAMQQWRKLKAEGVEDPNPHQKTLDDLQIFVQSQIMDGHEVIVMIDASSPGDDGPIKSFLDESGLFDLMDDYLPAQQPCTYQHGKLKIDHIWEHQGY